MYSAYNRDVNDQKMANYGTQSPFTTLSLKAESFVLRKKVVARLFNPAGWRGLTLFVEVRLGRWALSPSESPIASELPHTQKQTHPFQEFDLMRQLTLSLAVLALVAGTTFAGKYNKVISVGDKAPEFSEVPAVSADGKTELKLSLADAKEDVVVVAFLANHCPAVVACEDRLNDLVKSYKGKSVKFIGICCSNPSGYEETDGVAGIKKKIEEGKYSFVYGYDGGGKVGKSYGATNTPQFFVLDKTRTVKYTGRMDDKEGGKNFLKIAIDNTLSGETIEETETRAIGCGIPYKK